MSSGSSVIDVDVRLQKETAKVRFHDFCNLPRGQGAIISSSEFLCMGHRWKLQIERGVICYEWLGVHLLCTTKEVANTEHFWFSLKVRMPGNRKYANTGQIRPGLCAEVGDARFAKISSVEPSLVDGALVIEVAIWGLRGSGMQDFTPKNAFTENMLKLFNDKDSADVVILVGGRECTNAKKRAKTSPTKFYAHRLILEKCAPQLCQLVSGQEDHEAAIDCIKPEIFRHLLYYIYGGIIKDNDLEGAAREIIDAADMTGVVNLKLEAEACYVQSVTMSIHNFVDELLYAKSKNLALLKEAVMDFVANNRAEVRLNLIDIPVDVKADLAETLNAGEGGSSYDSLCVSGLRKRLEERGLDIDGSREAMISTLRDNDKEEVHNFNLD